jgi:LacI family transcriptional regulator
VDGLIVWAEARDRWVHDFVSRGVPVVSCGMEWQGVEGVTSIHMNFPEIQQRVIDHFHDLGMRRVVAIGHRLSERPMTARIMNSFVALARQSGMEGRLWELGGEDSPSVMPRRLLATGQETELEQFLKSLPKPVGIHCFGDHLGFIVCEVAAGAGLKVPDDLVIVGFGDNQVASFSNPPMTSVSGDGRAIGRAAADCMAAWLRTGRQPFQDMTVDGTVLIARESSVGKSGSVVIEAVQRFIRSQARRGLTLGELVAMSGLSVKTLVSQYRQAYGMEPTEAIHQCRLAEARRLLEDPGKSLSEVAIECGFSSSAAFTNYFKRHAGCPPKEGRKRERAVESER